MNRIRKGDHVVVITGKSKGQRGDVLRLAGDRIYVSNVNLVKRHTKPNPQANQPGGIVEREASERELHPGGRRSPDRGQRHSGSRRRCGSRGHDAREIERAILAHDDVRGGLVPRDLFDGEGVFGG